MAERGTVELGEVDEDEEEGSMVGCDCVKREEQPGSSGPRFSKVPGLDGARFNAQWPEIAGSRVAPAREEGLTLELATEKQSVEWTRGVTGQVFSRRYSGLTDRPMKIICIY